ncbi:MULTISPECIES: Hsp20/alpha crystallin family protein [Alphaproteobacteria]|jgi:HSP20 family protein|uniref:Hsp20/alpha crystallin family protein n=1 Tax=Henriciella mobilis TaxID=2305467 RepID=A0A399RFW1_9PROT|nr:Hsp20/alpha crystallin family protein [Henriciella mobilis]RIJ30466.1 Hsp20/alpha crystallin family protein [Henriciella mobilis]
MRIRDLVPWGRKKTDDGSETRSSGRSLVKSRDETQGSVISLQHELNDVFDRFFERFERPFFDRAGAMNVFSQPSVDVSESDKAIKVSVDLPGMDEDDIDVTLTGDVLTVRGERKAEREENKKGYFLHERSYGAFYRTIPLPPGVETDKAKAEFKKGVLTVTLPKSADAKRLTKRIEVKAA